MNAAIRTHCTRFPRRAGHHGHRAAALGYAELGLPVLALAPGTKIPLAGSAGLRDATTDRERIAAWWAGWMRQK